MYGIRDREAGNVIEKNLSKEEAEKMLVQFEEKDKEEDIYEEDFYEIYYEMEIKDIKNKYRMSLKEISERFGIPYRTVQNWNAGVRECPEYVIRMMDEILSK